MTMELSHIQCLSMFLKSGLDKNRNVVCFCEHDIEDVMYSFANCFSKLGIAYIMHNACITLECGNVFVFTYMNRVDKDKCIALSNYTNWVIQDGVIILCGDHHEMSDEDAATLVYKAQRTQEYTCNHAYLKNEYSILREIIDDVIKDNTKAVIQYANGDSKVVNYFIGMVHKKTNNKWEHDAIIKTLIPKLEEAANVCRNIVRAVNSDNQTSGDE